LHQNWLAPGPDKIRELQVYEVASKPAQTELIGINNPGEIISQPFTVTGVSVPRK